MAVTLYRAKAFPLCVCVCLLSLWGQFDFTSYGLCQDTCSKVECGSALGVGPT